MKRVGTTEGLLGMTQSSADSNRLYSILLDARASSISENMYDVTEKLLLNEKDNAKQALERLWALKKNLQIQGKTSTLDLLISFYQNKLDILREKEETIKKVSRDSRTLLEEKRKRDTEIASVNQEIDECTQEITRLTENLRKARVKAEELRLIEEQLNRELAGNENEIINGLYEIIMAQRPVIEAEPEAATESAAASVSATAQDCVNDPRTDEPAPVEPIAAGQDVQSVAVTETETDGDSARIVDELHALYTRIESGDTAPFPKSVVKTTRGVVIGEYYYDPRVYKNKRHYVFNSAYFMEQLARSIHGLKTRFDSMVHAETLQMIQDAFKRVAANPNLHFEISTNELVNEKNMRQLWQHAKEKNHAEVLNFCSRLSAKISALGTNYKTMLKEQIARYEES